MVVQYSPVQPGPETLLAFCFDMQRVLAGVVGRSRNLGRFLSVTDADHLPKNNWRLTELHRYHGILKEDEMYTTKRDREFTERIVHQAMHCGIQHPQKKDRQTCG